MKKNVSNILKFGTGLGISGFFLYLAFRNVELKRLVEVLRSADAVLILLGAVVMLVSHWFRAVRHHYFLAPIKQIGSGFLFSALMIGYMMNTFLPAHLGELVRAYVIGRKERISASSALATIAVERVVDVLCLLVIMGIVFIVYPFPELVKQSAFLTFLFVLVIIVFLVLLKKKPDAAFRLVNTLVRPLPKKIRDKLLKLLASFNEGVVALRTRKCYVAVFALSFLIWMCYAAVFAIGFYAFNFVSAYQLPFGASFVVLVITTISIVVPSSPGYVGTYHWLCMIALGLFAVPESPALGYAIVIHAISIFPVALVGVGFSLKEGIALSSISEQKDIRDLEL